MIRASVVLLLAATLGHPHIVFGQAPVPPTVITFEELPNTYSDAFARNPFPSSYQGLTWTGFLHYAPYTVNGYSPRGVNAIYAAPNTNPTITFPVPSEFMGAYFSAPQVNVPPVSRLYFEMSLRGVVVARSDDLASGNAFLPSGYTGPVDSVRIITIGRLAHPLGSAWVVDDVTFGPARATCVGIGPIKSFPELATRGDWSGTPRPTDQDLTDADELEAIARDYSPGPAQHEQLRIRGWVTTPQVDARLDAAVSAFQATISGRGSSRPQQHWPPRTSGYRPRVYQGHFYDLASLRGQLLAHVRAGATAAQRLQRADQCSDLIDAINREVRQHELAQAPEVLNQPWWVNALRPLRVSNPASEGGHASAHPRRNAVDMSFKYPSSRAIAGAEVSTTLLAHGLSRPYLPQDAVHVELSDSPASRTRQRYRLRFPVGPPPVVVTAAADAAGRLRPVVTLPDGRRVGMGADGSLINEVGPQARVATSEGVVSEIYIGEAPVGDYTVGGVASQSGTVAMEIERNGDERRPVRFVSSVAVGGDFAPITVTLPPVSDDAVRPLVIAPPSHAVVAPSAAGVVVGLTPAVESFLASATASDDWDPEPSLLDVRWNGNPIDASTVFPPGTHTVMFEYSDATGNVGSASSALSVVAPGTGAPGIPGFAATATGMSVSANWSAGAGPAPERFVVRVGTAPGRADAGEINVGRLTAGHGALRPGVYYLRVDAVNALGATPSSEIRLYVGSPPPPPPTIDAAVTGQQVSLRWAGDVPETTYAVHVGSRSGATDIASVSVGAQTSVSGVLPTGTYFVRVEAATLGGTSTSEELVLRTTCALPAAPTLTASVSGGRVALEWAPVSGAVRYQLQAGSAPSLSNLVNVDMGGTLSISAAPPRGTYYVRLIAVGACGSSAPSPEIPVVVP